MRRMQKKNIQSQVSETSYSGETTVTAPEISQQTDEFSLGLDYSFTQDFFEGNQVMYMKEGALAILGP